MDYKDLKKQLTAAVGGKDNIQNVTHCATRLRFILKDDAKFDEEKIKQIDGVVNTLKVGGQCQIIIGQHAKDVYNEFAADMDKNQTSGTKKSKKIKDIIYSFGEFMSASVGVYIIPMIGGGLLKAILTVLTQIGWMSATGDTYIVLWFAADAVFQFMPIFIAIGAARKLNANQMLAVFCVCIMLSPTYLSYVTGGTAISIFGFNIPLNNYHSTFLPALITVVVMAYLERGLKKILPDTLQMLLIPFLIILIMTPVSLLITGPLSNKLAEIISVPLIALGNYSYILVPVLGFIMPIMIMFGLHTPIFMFSFTTFVTMFGYDPIFMPASLCSHIAMGAVALAVFLRSKNQAIKNTAIASCASVWIGSVSEPVIFGVLLQNRRSMISAMIGGFAGAIVAGIAGVKCYALAGSGWLFIPTFIGAESSAIAVIASVLVACAVGFAVAMAIYKDPIEKEEKAIVE